MRVILPIAGPRDTTHLALRMLSRQRWTVVLAVITMIAQGLCLFAGPWVLGQLVDDIRAGRNTAWSSAAIIAVAAVLGAILEGIVALLVARVTEPALAQVREDVIETALHLPTSRVEKAGQGDLLSRVGDDIALVSKAVTQVIPALVYSVVNILFGAAGIFLVDWRLGLAGLIAVPFYVIAVRWYLPKSAPFYTRERIAQGERSEALLSGIYGANTLRAYRLNALHIDRINDRSADAMHISIERFRLVGRFFGRINRAEFIGMAMLLTSGFLFVRQDMITVGGVTAAALYFHKMFTPLGTLVFQFDAAQSAGASLARIAGVILMPHELGRSGQTTPDKTLTIDGITHHYDSNDVLHRVSLTLLPGERVALVGQTGAGKSTLASIAAGILSPSDGQVRLGVLDIENLDPVTLRKDVVLLSQDVHVFAGTLAEDLRMVHPAASDEDLRRALNTVGADWVHALPAGLATKVGEGAYAMTPMQAQHLALARLILADPAIAILDEATAEAGSTGARELEDAALAATEGRTALIVAHRLTQAETADRVIVLADGRIIEQGTHNELVAAGGRYADLWQAWSTN